MISFIIFVAPFIVVILSIIVAFWTAPMDSLAKKE